MRETIRRKKLQRALETGQREAADQIAILLDRRFKALKRELRRANLRKRLTKALKASGNTGALLELMALSPGDQTAAPDTVMQVFGDELMKAGWLDWIGDFTTRLKDALVSIVRRLHPVEAEYWLNRGQHLESVDPADVIAAYEARTGRQIRNIAEETKQNVLRELTEWYNSDEDFPALLERLGKYFSPERAEIIARTESAFISSQVSLAAMDQFGIDRFNFDLTPHPGDARYPCPQCVAYAAENPHQRGDPMPPLHPGCDDGIVYVIEDENA